MASHHVIVGSGIAALAAAESLRQHDAHATITLVSEETHPFYSRPGLAYLLRGDIPEKQLFLRTSRDLAEVNLERANGRVAQIDGKRHEAVLENGRRLKYDRLLLATGALAAAPSMPGGDLAGVVKLDSLDDARHILNLARRCKNAVVIGGGITALEIVEGLAARGVRVHYFLRGDRYWADVLDEIESGIVMSRLSHEGVTVHANTQVKQAAGDASGQLHGVETMEGKLVPCQMLAVAIGVRPRIDLARQAGLNVDRGIVVDPRMRTSVADIFAAGDVTEVHDPRGGPPLRDVLWPIALKQGQVAGANMAGVNHVYEKAPSMNVTQLTGLKVTIIGNVGTKKGGQAPGDQDLLTIARGESESWRLLPSSWVLSERDDVNRMRLVVGERSIVGALVMGAQTWSRPLQRLVAEDADITPIRAALQHGGPDALEQLAQFYLHWQSQLARGQVRQGS